MNGLTTIYQNLKACAEYFMHGIVVKKTDIFSYGGLLLELITGRRALDESQKSLVLWSKPLLDDNNVKELVDLSLHGNYDPKEMNCVILFASLCIEQISILRPQMSEARFIYFYWARFLLFYEAKIISQIIQRDMINSSFNKHSQKKYLMHKNTTQPIIESSIPKQDVKAE